jgi:hypothetical protein
MLRNSQRVSLGPGLILWYDLSNEWWGNLKKRDHLGDPRRRWEDNIKMDLQEVGYGGMD